MFSVLFPIPSNFLVVLKATVYLVPFFKVFKKLREELMTLGELGHWPPWVVDVGQPRFSLLKKQEKYLKNEKLSAFMNSLSLKRFHLNTTI
jgi:hypothetical protein